MTLRTEPETPGERLLREGHPVNEDGTATKLPTTTPQISADQLLDKPPELSEVAFAIVLDLAKHNMPRVSKLSDLAQESDLEGVWKHGYTAGVQAARQLLDRTESFWRGVGWMSATQMLLGEKPGGGSWTIVEVIHEIRASAPPPRTSDLPRRTKRLNRHGYEQLVEGDLAWLRQQGSEHSLERKHIELVLTNSLEFEYPDPERPGLDIDQNLVDRLAFAISHLPRDDAGNRKAARLGLDMGMRFGDESSLTALLTEQVKDLRGRLETANAVAEKRSLDLAALEERLAEERDRKFSSQPATATERQLESVRQLASGNTHGVAENLTDDGWSPALQAVWTLHRALRAVVPSRDRLLEVAREAVKKESEIHGRQYPMPDDVYFAIVDALLGAVGAGALARPPYVLPETARTLDGTDCGGYVLEAGTVYRHPETGRITYQHLVNWRTVFPWMRGVVDPWDSLTKIIAAARETGVDPALVKISVHADRDGEPSVPLIDLLGRYGGG